MRLSAFLIGLIPAVLTVNETHATLLFAGDFENGARTQYEQLEACCSHSSSMLAVPVRHGKFAHRVELRKTDADQGGNKQVALVQRGERLAGGVGDERWFGFSVYIPPDWVNDVPGADDVIWQIQEATDSCKVTRRPPVILKIVGGNWIYQKRHDPAPCGQSSSQEKVTDLPLGAMEKGKWTDFVIRAKWSHQMDGFLKIWKNGVRVLSEKGPNFHNSDSAGLMRFGLEKAIWKSDPSASVVSSRVIYQDEMRVGDGRSSYWAVAPRESKSSPIAAPSPQRGLRLTQDSR